MFHCRLNITLSYFHSSINQLVTGASKKNVYASNGNSMCYLLSDINLSQIKLINLSGTDWQLIKNSHGCLFIACFVLLYLEFCRMDPQFFCEIILHKHLQDNVRNQRLHDHVNTYFNKVIHQPIIHLSIVCLFTGLLCSQSCFQTVGGSRVPSESPLMRHHAERHQNWGGGLCCFQAHITIQ